MDDDDFRVVLDSADQAPAVTGDDDIDHVIANPLPKAAKSKNKTEEMRDALARGPDNPLAETAHHIISGTGHAIVGGYKGLANLATGQGLDAAAKAVQDETDKTYQPDSTAGQALSGALASNYNPLNWPQAGARYLAGKSSEAGLPPVVSTAIEAAPTVLGALGLARGIRGGNVALTRTGAPELPTMAAQAAVDRAAAQQSGGAAGAGRDVSQMTPETQDEIARIGAQGGKLNQTALERIHDAESLPVPVRLMAGQARDDSAMASAEFNAKLKHPEIGERFNQQNDALTQSLDTLRREAAPGAVGNSTLQNSQGLIDRLKDVRLARKADITAKYNAAKAANDGDLQMDGSGFVAQAEAALKPQSKSRFLPAAVRGILDDVTESGGKMSLDDFEAHRTTLANEARKAQRAGDGNAEAAVNKVRDALEDTPPAGETSAKAKALYDVARKAAKADFAEQKINPAYRAAADDLDITPRGEASDLNKNFAQKYVLGGSQANLQRMRTLFGDDEAAHQTMTAIALNHLKDSAGIIGDSGNFRQRGYNDALETEIGPRAKELLRDPELIENVAKLGRVARYTMEQKRGAGFNNSHTHVASIADSGVGQFLHHTAQPIPGVNYLAGKAAEHLQAGARQRMLETVLKPGAGLEDH